MKIIVATDEEYVFIRNLFQDQYEIVQTGAGGPNTVAKLVNLDKTEPLLSIGFACSNNLEIGTVAIIKNVALYHPNRAFEESVYQLDQNIPDNIIRTIVETGKPQRILRESPVACLTSSDLIEKTVIEEPVIFDMELVYLPALGFEHVSAIKIISDNFNLHERAKTFTA
ncbi:hypothetical protein IKG06_03165 [Candidatus Saccharibacteria bacterium]|nr:hypothetical protein [Candidatus Saccharibacteria bacterium]